MKERAAAFALILTGAARAAGAGARSQRAGLNRNLQCALTINARKFSPISRTRRRRMPAEHNQCLKALRKRSGAARMPQRPARVRSIEGSKTADLKHFYEKARYQDVYRNGRPPFWRTFAHVGGRVKIGLDLVLGGGRRVNSPVLVPLSSKPLSIA